MPRQGSYLQSIGYESRVLTNTPWGEKEFGDKFNSTQWAWKIKNILKLRSLTYTAHCVKLEQNFV